MDIVSENMGNFKTEMKVVFFFFKENFKTEKQHLALTFLNHNKKLISN